MLLLFIMKALQIYRIVILYKNESVFIYKQELLRTYFMCSSTQKQGIR